MPSAGSLDLARLVLARADKLHAASIEAEFQRLRTEQAEQRAAERREQAEREKVAAAEAAAARRARGYGSRPAKARPAPSAPARSRDELEASVVELREKARRARSRVAAQRAELKSLTNRAASTATGKRRPKSPRISDTSGMAAEVRSVQRQINQARLEVDQLRGVQSALRRTVRGMAEETPQAPFAVAAAAMTVHVADTYR